MSLRVLFNFLFVIAAITCGIALTMKPWTVYKEQKVIAESYQEDANKAERERVKLEQDRAKLDSTLGQEELARQSGFRRAGETPIDLGN